MPVGLAGEGHCGRHNDISVCSLGRHRYLFSTGEASVGVETVDQSRGLNV